MTDKKILLKDFGTQTQILDRWAFEHYKKTVINELEWERYAREKDYERSVLFRRFDGQSKFYKFERWFY